MAESSIVASVDVRAGGYTVRVSGANFLEVARTVYGVVMLMETEVWSECPCTGTAGTDSDSPVHPVDRLRPAPAPISGA